MVKLRLGVIESDKPVRLTIDISASVHRDLIVYAEIHARETGQQPLAPAKLAGPMLERFMAADREFRKRSRHLPKERAQVKAE